MGWRMRDLEDLDHWAEAIVSNTRIWRVYKSGYAMTHEGIKPEVLEWLEANVGPRDTVRVMGAWRMTIPITDSTTRFYFEDHSKAVLFKLTWG